MAEDLRGMKVAFNFGFLAALKNAILGRPRIKFGEGFMVTEKDGEVLVTLAGSFGTKPTSGN